MSNKIRTKINPISGGDFTFENDGKLYHIILQPNTLLQQRLRRQLANKEMLSKVLGIKQAGERIDQISNALVAQGEPQGNLIAGKSTKMNDFVNDIVYKIFVNTVNGLIDSGFSRTQAVNKGLEVAFRMTKSQYEKVYNIVDPDRFPSKQMAIDFNNTIQMGNLRQAITFFQ